MPDGLEGLRAAPAFAELAPELQARLEQAFRPVSAARGEWLCEPGQAVPGFFVILDGFVKQVRPSGDGRELLMALLGPREAFGPCCDPLIATPVTCGTRALTRVRALLMPRATYRSLLFAEPAITQAIVGSLTGVRSYCTSMAARLAFHDVERRLSDLLSTLARWGTRHGESIELPAVLTHAEMADAVGASREVVTRSLARLEAQGVIRRRGRRILLENPPTQQAP